MKTKAVILASAVDAAHFSLAEHHAKILFPLADGDPLLVHLLRGLEASGINDVVLVAPQQVLDHAVVADVLSQSQVTVVADDGLSGTAGALLKLRDFVGSGLFVVTGTEVLLKGIDLPAIVSDHRQRRATATVVLEEEKPVERGVENVQVTAEGTVKQFHMLHRSRDLRRSFRPTGLYVFSPGVLDWVFPDMYMDIKEQLVLELNDNGQKVCAYKTDTPVYRLESVDDYLQLNRDLLEDAAAMMAAQGTKTEVSDRVWVGRNAVVSDQAYVLGPVVIGDDCVIEEGAQVIGPTTICSGTRVGRFALVRDSTVWSGCQLQGRSQVQFSVVAEGCSIPSDTVVTRSVVTRSNQHAAGIQRFPFLPTRHGVLPIREKTRPSVAKRLGGVWRHLCRRLIDVAVSGFGVALLTPLFAVIAVMIKRESSGSVFFVHRRCGQYGHEFKMYKFRTMVADADKIQLDMMRHNEVDGPMLKLANDPRVTRIGKFLRQTSLDELPQLFNVLKGDMSLIGPRPLAIDELKYCPRWRDGRLGIRPGLTGLWQVNARHSHRFGDWIKYDLDYVKHRSFMLDLRIFMKTVKSLVKR